MLVVGGIYERVARQVVWVGGVGGWGGVGRRFGCDFLDNNNSRYRTCSLVVIISPAFAHKIWPILKITPLIP